MASFTSLDGGTVEIDGGGLGVDQSGATRFAVWRDALGYHEFTVGSLKLGELQGADEGVQLSQDYSLATGGRLRTGSGTATDPVTKVVATSILGVWIGSRFSVHLWLSGVGAPEPLTLQMLNIFNEFVFTETPTGIVMRAANPSGSTLVRDAIHAPSVVRSVDGLGLVKVCQRTPNQEWRVPTTAGASVAGGELWVEGRAPAEQDTEPVLTFLLANDTAVARVFTDVAQVSEDQLLERCSRLTVTWKPQLAL